MKTNNKYSKLNIVAKKAIFMSSAIALSLGVIALNFTKEDPYFYKLRSNFDSELPYIKSAADPDTNNHVTMTHVKNNQSANYTDNVITIENADELGYFSSLCNSSSKDTFLKYNYILIDNIDATSINGFNPIGWENSHAFKGTFDGQGYEIRGLDLIINQTTTYTGTYYSMFGINQGTIQNVGLYYPNIAISGTVTNLGNGGVSYLVGLNDEGAKVDHCFVVDDGYVLDSQKATSTDEELKRSGITAPEQRISTLCINNKGTLTNNYVAVGVVADIQYQFAEMAEITLTNLDNNENCECTNNYYYNKSIQSVVGDTVTFKDGYGIESRSKSRYGTRCVTSNDLISALSSTYYTKNSYGSLGSYTGIKYGITRGMDYDTSTMTFTVENAYDFAYMFELFNTDAHLAADDVSFKIIDNIDLSLIPVTAYSYAKGIGATIYGDKLSKYYDDELYEQKKKVTMIDNNKSDYPTIYNADVMNPARIAKNVGVDCYGLFNFVTGKIQNLNLYTTTMDLANVRTIGDDGKTIANIKGIGALCGYVEQGEIDGVNVFANVTNTSDTSIDEYYLGGITGILGGNGVIKNSTSAGSINIGSKTNSVQTSTYMSGIAVGGIVGYIESSSGNVRDCTNAMNITLGLGSNITYAVGGVIGAGYTTSSPYTVTSNGESVEQPGETSNLENVGNITVGVSGSSTYNELYVSGVLGRHLGMTAQVKNFNNYGNITVYSNTSKDTYVSGVSNADIKTTSNNGLKASEFVNKANQFLYYASGFKNGGKVVVNTSANSNMLYYTNVLNIKASNGFISKVDGLFNLSYYSKYNAASSTVGLEKTKTAIDDQEINMNKFYTFAPVANVIGGSSAYRTELDNAYNLRNINYTIDSAITTATNLNYTGCVYGEYVTYNDCRNEGNLTFTLNKAITGNLTVSGLFNEVSSGSKANNLYNAGKIDIKYTATFTGNIYASGVCYANRNGFSNSEILKYNPASDDYDKSLIGSINNAINDGDITITSPNFVDDNLNYTDTTVWSANASSYLGSVWDTAFKNDDNKVYVTGDIYATGIVSINESVITNSFNIANFLAANYVQNTSDKSEINAAGISILNIGKFAYIINCANDGDIKAFNLSSGTTYLSEVNAAGISCRNDELENGSSYSGNSSNPHSSQVISFTINYGSIYSYNYRYNITSTNMEPTAKSAGILAMGLCNVINVENYGNIYGSETASGIFGIVYFVKFASEVTSNIYIANTINYGNVYMLERGYNYIHGNTYDDYDKVTYNTFIGLNISTAEEYALTSVVRNTDYLSVIGSVFSIINFGNQSNADKIVIRYLISFNEDIAISGFITAYDVSLNPDTSTFYSAHLSENAATGAYMSDSYMKNYTQYAPLISSDFSGKFVTYINTTTGEVTTEDKTYTGVFSSSFPFRLAISGDAKYLDISHYSTDIFISDYFEFVGSTYVNTNLLEKIGWGEIAYNAAAESFATNLEAVSLFINKLSVVSNYHYSNLITDALSADTWINKCDTSILLSVTQTIIDNEDSETLEDIVDYIFTSTSSSYSLITNSVRREILEMILENDTTLSYSSLFETLINYVNGYSEILANSVLDSNNDAGKYLYSYINSLPKSTIESILTTYCNYLKNAETNGYFNYSNSEQARFDILAAIFENINDNSFYTGLAELIDITDLNNVSVNELVNMYQGYYSLTDENKVALYQAIMLNNVAPNSLGRLYTYISSMANEIGYFSKIISNGYSKTSLSNIYSDINFADNQSQNTYPSELSSVVDERVALWNQIRLSTVFENYLNSLIKDDLYFLATEYNNTYQSLTEPHNEGTFIGDTELRLSYLYETNITPQVYFYGPYTDSSGNWSFSNKLAGESHLVENELYTNTKKLTGRNTYYFSLFHSSDNTLWESNNLMLSRGGMNSTTTFSEALDPTGDETYTDYPVPMLIYYDFNNEQLGGANDTFTLSDDYYVSGNYTAGIHTFRGFSTQQFTVNGDSFIDPLLNQKLDATDWCGVMFTTNDLYMYVSNTGETFSLNNATMGPRFSEGQNQTITLSNGTTATTKQYRCYIQDSNGTNHLVQADSTDTIQIGKYVNNVFTPIHTLKNFTGYSRQVYSFIASEVGIDMWTSTVNTNYHPTRRTGIYRRGAAWNNYFTWKQKEGFMNRVFTSQYIDYSIKDLLNLDGYLTQYSDGTYQSTDERNIINYIFNHYLVEDSSNFKKVVAAALLERNMYDAEFNVDYNYLNNFFVTNIYTNSTIGEVSPGVSPFDYLYQNYEERTSIKYYLTHLSSSTISKDKLLSYCASNQTAYAKLLLELIYFDSFSTSLPINIGNSTDSEAKIIDGINSYTNLTAISTNVTITDSDETTKEYYYGYTFNNLNVELDPSYERIALFVGPVNSSGTLKYALDNGTYVTTTIDENKFIIINSNNNSLLKLRSDNKDIVFFEVVYAPNYFDDSDTWQYFYDSDTTYKPGYLIYKLPTLAEVEEYVTNYIYDFMSDYGYESSDILTIDININGISVVTMNKASGNDMNHYRYHRLVVDTDGRTETSNDTTIIDESPYPIGFGNRTTSFDDHKTYTFELDESYLGKNIGLLSRRHDQNKYEYFTTTRNAGYYRHKIGEISIGFDYAITYSNSYTTEYYYSDSTNVSIFGQSQIQNSIFSKVEMLVNTLKNRDNYSIIYKNFISKATQNLTPIDYSKIQYCSTLASSTYYFRSGTEGNYSYSLATGEYNSNNTYYVRSGTGTNEDPYVYTLDSSITSALYYNSCTSNMYYVRSGTEGNYSYNLATGDYSSSTTYYKYDSTEYSSVGKAAINIIDLLNLSATHTDGITPEYCTPDFIELLLISSNESFKTFIDDVVKNSVNSEDDIELIFKKLVSLLGYYPLRDAIYEENTSFSTLVKRVIAAAYLVSDYKYLLNNNAPVKNSVLKSFINNAFADEYHYINSSGTEAYDIEKFYAFARFIEYNLSTSGYGIYALASNNGKLNGVYIPDNLDIKTMDAPYAEITIKNEKNTDVNVRSLQNGNSAYWRGGTSVDLENKNTVNYAFYKDMKQIEASISTAVFELDINYNNTIYYGDIDLDKKTVTFYVPSIIGGTYTITKQDYAYKAESDLGNSISVTSTTSGAIQDTFVVTAENTAVIETYSIIFETIVVDFDLTYSDSENSTYKSYDAFDEDLPITLTLTSVEGKELPEGLNLEHYISFVGTNTYTPFDKNPVISLSASSVDHIVDKNGNATITIIVSPKLKADEYQITVSMLSGTASVTFEKKASYDKEITKFSYNGEPLTFDEYDTVESVIPFGRAFDYEELTDPDSGRFYLNEFEYSNNATVVITATNTTIDEHGLMTYVVTFSVTAEAGGDAREYTHKLKEKQYFDEPESELDEKVYANLYVDGDVVKTTDSYDLLSEQARVKYLSGGTFTYALASDDFNGTAGTSLHDNMLMKVSFNRGVEPQYRVKYVLDNFYTLGSNVEFKPTAATSANLASIQNTYAGLTVTVTNNNNTGVYTFVYTYTNTGMWKEENEHGEIVDVEYERYYEFPELIIEKLASTDALLHEITFLEEAVSLGNTATVILPNTVLIPNRDDSGDDKIVGYESSDVVYNDAFTDTQYQNIKVSSRGINYTNDSDSTDISDYFIIGTVSNADLSYYCPNFGINKYAQMYQYTTSEKLMHYGAGVDSEGHNIQTRTDHAILTDHRAVNTMYLYVPFTNGTDKEIFLVEIDSNGYWTNVYRTTFNGKNASATVNNKPVTVGAYPANTVKTLYAKDAAALNGYYVCDYAGSSTNNDSLFMDYVGTPVDGHFWYVSYVIFSEDKLSDGNLAGNIRYYHISLIDLTNNIQFYVTVYAKPTLNPSDLYLTIAENSYDKKTGVQTKTQISAYAVNNNNEVYDNDSTEEDRDDIDGYKIYRLRYVLQSLPHGYFYFYIDLPDGYVATAHTNKVNQLIIYEADGKTVKSRDARYLTEAGSFLPFSSIITQKVDLEIIVDEGTGEDASAWAVATSDIYTRQAKYEGLIPA